MISPRHVLRRLSRRLAADIVEAASKNPIHVVQAPSVGHPNAGGHVRVDVVDMLHQLNTGAAKEELNHFFAWNHRWVALLSERNRRTAIDTYDFVDSEFGDALFHLDQFRSLSEHVDHVRESGDVVLDFGVYKGGSTRRLARMFPDLEIHGFDSFEGLPERWSHAFRGDFGDIKGALPEVPDNVTLHAGWFDETCPTWVAAHPDPQIGLLRIDCDIYSSTATIFESFGPFLKPGTLVLFDELIGYRGWRHHEYAALQEFLSLSELSVRYHAYGLTYVLVELVAGHS